MTNLISSGCGQDTSACRIPGHSLPVAFKITICNAFFIQRGHDRSLIGERRWPQNKTAIVNRYQTTVAVTWSRKKMVFWIDDANPDATPSQHEDRFSRYGDSHIKDKTITVLSLTRGSLIHGVRAFWILEVQFGSCGYRDPVVSK